MRRDTQIGIILGIVILVIIGVFLSTRATDNEAVLPDLVLSEGAGQRTKTKEIDINGLFKASKKAEPEEEPAIEYTTEETLVSDELAESAHMGNQPEMTIVDTSSEDTSLEGKWEGVAEEILEDVEIIEEVEIVVEGETVKDIQIAQDITSVEATVVSEEEPEATSYATKTEDVYYKVQSNDNLFKIARKHYGDGQKWNKIFEANRDSMPDSNSLYVGQKLLIPDITINNSAREAVVTQVNSTQSRKTGGVVTHTVQAGDTLYRIAEKYYDNPGVWTKILEANEDTIEDKGLLRKGQVIIIPNL